MGLRELLESKGKALTGNGNVERPESEVRSGGVSFDVAAAVSPGGMVPVTGGTLIGPLCPTSPTEVPVNLLQPCGSEERADGDEEGEDDAEDGGLPGVRDMDTVC